MFFHYIRIFFVWVLRGIYYKKLELTYFRLKGENNYERHGRPI